MTLLLGVLVIAAAVIAVVRNLEVRSTLLLAALTLGAIVGEPAVIFRKFFSTLGAEEFLIPICTAMGFAHVLRHTGCDRHLVQVLVRPLRNGRLLLVPGAVLVGFVVNIPIISQTAAAAAVGSVLIPLLRAGGVSPVVAGSSLLLGVSIGGELLNQGAPEFRTVIRETAALGLAAPSGAQCVQAVLPLVALHLAVSTGAFWLLTARHASRRLADPGEAPAAGAAEPPLRVSYLKAAVPLVPLVLLFVVAPPLQLVRIPQGWLVGPREPAPVLSAAAATYGDPRLAEGATNPFDSRLVGAAMVAMVVAVLVSRRGARGAVGSFFEGMGYGFANIISIIVAAACFGEGVKLLGLHRLLGDLFVSHPQLLVPAAGFVPLGFGFVSGSGMAATQSLFSLFAAPSMSLGVAPEHVGAVVSLGAAAGRTMSPVAAVTLMCASLTATSPSRLVRRVAVPLLAGIVAVALAGSLMASRGVRAPAPAALESDALALPARVR